MHPTVPKCLTSPCVCKHITLQNQKTAFFFTWTLNVRIKSSKYWRKFCQEVYRPRLCSVQNICLQHQQRQTLISQLIDGDIQNALTASTFSALRMTQGHILCRRCVIIIEPVARSLCGKLHNPRLLQFLFGSSLINRLPKWYFFDIHNFWIVILSSLLLLQAANVINKQWCIYDVIKTLLK